MTEWHLRAGHWECVIDGRVVDSLKFDRETMQYADSRGVLVGRKWEEAKAKVEAKHGKHGKA